MGPTRPCLEDGRGDNRGSVFSSLLALGNGGSFAHQTSSLHAERGGDLDVNELISVLGAWFGDSHVHSRAVFGVNGRVVHKDFDVCTKAGSSRDVRNFVSESIVPCGEGVSARARRRVLAFLVQGGSALGSVVLLVFAPITRVTHGSASPHSGRLLECGVVHNRGVGDRELEETRGTGSAGTVKSNPVSAVGSNAISQVSGGFVDAGESEGALRGCCGSESCQVTGVFASFSPDGLELGQGIPSGAVRSSMQPNPILAVTLTAHEAATLQKAARSHLHASG